MTARNRRAIAPQHGGTLAFGAVTIAALCYGLTGCGRSASASATASSRLPAKPTAKQVLEATAANYREASSYEDSGKLRLSLKRNGETLNDSADMAVTLERPNKLRLHCYQAIVLADGRMLRASIADLPGQILAVPAPPLMTVAALQSDSLLAAVLTQGIAGSAPQLSLLLDEEAAKSIVGEGKIQPLETADLDGTRCFRLRIARKDGELTLWIDAEALVLRRIDYPVAELTRALSADEVVSDVVLTAEFPGARLNHKIDAVAFRFEAPQGAKLVKQFNTRLTPPQPPSSLLGTTAADFSFVGLDGQAIDKSMLVGKVVVLDFWATWCGPCTQSLPKLAELRQTLSDRVEFVAVSIDDANVTDDQVRDALTKLGADVPAARDPQQHAASRFGVQSIPNLIVLSPTGQVQWHEIGFNPQLVEQLGPRLERLLAGKDIWREAHDEYRVAKQEFEQAAAELPTVR